MQATANKYASDVDKIIDFIKRRQEHHETASSFEVIVEFRKYVLDDRMSDKSLDDFLQKTNRKNVLSTEETRKYIALFDSYTAKLQSTQKTINKVSN